MTAINFRIVFRLPNSITISQSLTNANAGCAPRATVRMLWAKRPEPRQRWTMYLLTKRWRSCDDKNPGLTRAWRNHRHWYGREPDDGGRSMASWLSRRPHSRRFGGWRHPWRGACSAKALLRLRVRPGLFRASMLRAARTLLGRMGLARSPHRGLLLTRRAS